MQDCKKALNSAFIVLTLVLKIFNSEIYGGEEKECILRKEIEESLGSKLGLTSEKALIIIFFSLDCSVCYREILKFNELYDRFKSKIKVIGVSRERKDMVLGFQRTYGIKFPLYNDPSGRLHKRFKVKVLPYKIVVKCNKVIYQDDVYKNPLELQNAFDKVLMEISK